MPGMLFLSAPFFSFLYLRGIPLTLALRRTSNTVCWWNNVDVASPGECWGYTTQNSSSGEFQFEKQLICDAAGWINES